MRNNKDLGQYGENLARRYLVRQGYEIVASNYRYKRAEIDLIAMHNGQLIFLEVKMRSNLSFGMPESFVDEKKAEMIHYAAEAYIIENDWQANIRFDILAIVQQKNSLTIKHFEDAF
jgi:putative endonuclease